MAPNFRPKYSKSHGISVLQKLDPAVKKPYGKVGLVLAGGAFSGGAFKAGGLRALDEMLVSRRSQTSGSYAFCLNEFDVFVGLSAGSILAYALSAGLTPDEIYNIVAGQSETFESIKPWHVMRPNATEMPSRALNFGERATHLIGNWLRREVNPKSGARYSLAGTLKKVVESSARLLPTGLFDPHSIESYLRRNMKRAGIPDDFVRAHKQTGKELYLTATDINRGELVVFGHDEPYRDVPMSTAVAASCALPFWYQPMLVDNPRKHVPGEAERLDLVDGSVMRTANLRVAVEKGCDLVICYNPFTKIRYEQKSGEGLYEHGPFALGSQSARTLIGTRLDQAKELLYHDDSVQADVIFIEPAEDDYAFFGINPLNFWSTERAAEHGYSQVRDSMLSSFELLRPIFANHGIAIRPPVTGQIMPLPTRAGGTVEISEADMRESRGAHQR